MNLALVNTGRLGDLVASLGLVQAFIDQGHGVTLVTRRGLEHLLLDTTLAPAVTGGRPPRYDTLIDLSHSHRSRSLAEGLVADRRIALHNPKRTGWLKALHSRLFYTEQLPEASRHIGGRYEAVASLFGLRLGEPRLTLTAPVTRTERGVALHVGAGQAVRVLPVDMLAGIAARVLECGADLRLFGTEREIALDLERVLGRPLNHVRAGLRELPGELACCRMFIGADSGLLHLACALGVPSVGIFGPNVPARSAPCSSVLSVVDAPLECRPCDQRAACPRERACYGQIDRAALHALISDTVVRHAGAPPGA